MPLPPGPALSPEEQTFHWFSRPYAFLKQCAQRYGETFTLEFKGLGKHILFSSPEAIQEIFSGDAEVFHAGEGNAIIRPFLGSHSLLMLDGPEYRRHRKLMLPAFHPKRIAEFGSMMDEVAARKVAAWKPGVPFSAHARMLDISLEIILRTVFGMNDPERFRKMKDLLVTLLEAVSFSTIIHAPEEAGGASFSAWERFSERREKLESLLRAEIAAHRAAEQGGVLSLLLAEGDAENAPLTDDELRDELVTLLIAGHETTATALAWAFYWIHADAEVKQRLVTELDAVTGTGAARIEALLALPYLDAVVKETLRIRPVIPVVSRKLAAGATVEGREYPAGTHLVPCIYLAHHRKATFPKPEVFRPERFLERHFTPFEYLPFGGGVRRCLGMGFGQSEMKIVLANALQKFSFRLADESGVRPVRRSVVVAPSGGVKLVAEPR
jgi:cytochrome P450